MPKLVFRLILQNNSSFFWFTLRCILDILTLLDHDPSIVSFHWPNYFMHEAPKVNLENSTGVPNPNRTTACFRMSGNLIAIRFNLIPPPGPAGLPDRNSAQEALLPHDSGLMIHQSPYILQNGQGE